MATVQRTPVGELGKSKIKAIHVDVYIFDLKSRKLFFIWWFWKVVFDDSLSAADYQTLFVVSEEFEMKKCFIVGLLC